MNAAIKENKKIRQKQSTADRIFDIVNWVVLTAVLIVVLYPLIYVCSASVSDPTTVNSGEMWLYPVEFTLEGYERIFEYKDIWTGYLRTIEYTVVGTFLSLATVLMYGYALSRKDLVGRRLFSIVILVTMYLNGGVVSTYIVIRNLGWLNTRFIMYVCGMSSAYNILVCRTFFSSSIPDALREAAIIDGCSNWKLFFRIILPLSKALIVVMILFTSVTRWNWYFWPMVLLKDRELFTLQIILKEILIQSQMNATMMSSGMGFVEIQRQAEIAQMIKFGVIIVSCLPMMIVYPFLQRFFEKGVMIGAVKG